MASVTGLFLIPDHFCKGEKVLFMGTDDRLASLLKDISENCKYYSDRGCSTSLEEYPIIDKTVYAAIQYETLFHSGMGCARSQTVIKSTSGSCGYPLQIYWNINDYYSSVSTIWRRRKRFYGILPTDLKLSFKVFDAIVPSFAKERYNLIANSLTLLSKDRFLVLYQGICRFSPKWMYVLPHLFRIFVNRIEENRLPFPPTIQYVEFFGEYISQEEEQYYRGNLQHIAFANMYGAEEVNSIAYECPFHHLHVLRDNVFTEVLSDGFPVHPTGSGNLVVTSLHNHFMPVIRYNLFDRVLLLQNDIRCACGENNPLDVEVLDRNSELVHCDDCSLSPSILSSIVTKFNVQWGMPIEFFYFDFYDLRKELTVNARIKECSRIQLPFIRDKLSELLSNRINFNRIGFNFENVNIDLSKHHILNIVRN